MATARGSDITWKCACGTRWTSESTVYVTCCPKCGREYGIFGHNNDPQEAVVPLKPTARPKTISELLCAAGVIPGGLAKWSLSLDAMEPGIATITTVAEKWSTDDTDVKMTKILKDYVLVERTLYTETHKALAAADIALGNGDDEALKVQEHVRRTLVQWKKPQ